MHQQPLYLSPADADTLDQLSAEVGKPKQTLLREAVTDLFVKYRAQGRLQPRPADIGSLSLEEARRVLAREIRAGASIDVDALVAAGELIPRGRGWYAVRDVSSIGKVNQITTEIAQHRNPKGGGSEIRLKLSSVAKWRKLAAKLKPEY